MNMMTKDKLLRQSMKLAKCVTSTHRPLTQVTHFSVLIQSSPVFLPRIPQIYGNVMRNFHKVSFFSTKTEPFIDVVLSKNDWSKEMEDYLEEMNPKLTHECIVYTLLSLRKNPHKALDFFRWVCDTKGFEPSSVVYDMMLRTLVGKDMMDKFWKFANEMKEKGLFITEKTYTQVNMFLSLHRLWQLKREWDKYYGIWYASYMRSPLAEKGYEVFNALREFDSWYSRDMEQQPLTAQGVDQELNKIEFPLTESFLVFVIQIPDQKPSKLLRVFEWFRDYRGYKHNAVTYNELVKILARPDSIHEFWDVVDLMRSEGYELALDTYMIARKSLPRKDAAALFLFMMDGLYKLSAKDCAWIINNLSLDADPDIDLAFRVANKFEAAGNNQTPSIYEVLHRCLCNCGKFDEAEKIIEAIVRDTGCLSYNILYSQEIYGLCKLKKFDEAWTVLDKVEAQGCIPNIKTWTVIVQFYCKADQFDRALLCLDRMKLKNMIPDSDLLDILLKGYVSQNKHLGAYSFLSEMVKKSVVKPLRRTYKFILVELISNGKFKEALQVVNMMKRHKYELGSPFYFIRCVLNYGSVKDAKDFLKAYPLKVNKVVEFYSYFIRFFLHKGRVQEAKDLLYSSPPLVHTEELFTLDYGSKRPWSLSKLIEYRESPEAKQQSMQNCNLQV